MVEVRRTSQDVDVVAGVSDAGRLLHYQAILDSFLAGNGAFVSDFYLAAHGSAREAVRELQSQRVWRRVEGGFVPLESEATRVALAVSDALGAAVSATSRRASRKPERHLHLVAHLVTDDAADTASA